MTPTPCESSIAQPCEISYIEDNDADAVMIETAIRQSGCSRNPTRFVGSEEFLSHLDGIRRPAPWHHGSLLIDINLPSGSGFDILERVRQQYGPGELPVAIFSGGAREAEVTHAYELGANVYIHKPMAYPEYRRRITGLCGFFSRLKTAPESG